jgi:DUF1365 family protein
VTASSRIRSAAVGAAVLPEGVEVPALYRAVIHHHRRAPITNRFRYRTFYWLVDIDATPVLPPPLRPFARFRRSDHLDVRQVLADAGLTATRIVRLAHARSFGYVFNPLSVYWCYQYGELVAAVAEVHNTYGGRHAYLLPLDRTGAAEVDKALYVSPFYPVDGRYDIRVSPPAERLNVAITLNRADQPFTASLTGERVEASLPRLLALTARYPLTPLRTALLIRRQGVRLWAKGLTVQPR